MRSRFSLAAFCLLVLLLIFFAFAFWRTPHPEPPYRQQRSRAYPDADPYSRESRQRRHERRESKRHEQESRAPGWEQPRNQGQVSASCQALGLTCTSTYFQSWDEPAVGTCVVRTSQTPYPLPDPRCTPGGINPSITTEVLRDPQWRTRCTRNCQLSESEKHVAYELYGLPRPHGNSGENQVCELDHLVPLEMGGADGLGNIWPECGPDQTTLNDRYFKIKDRVENYLADEVKRGDMPLDQAQRGIAADWTRYLPAANRYCSAGGRC